MAGNNIKNIKQTEVNDLLDTFLKDAFGNKSLAKRKESMIKEIYGDKFDPNKGLDIYKEDSIDAVAKYMATHKDEVNKNFDIGKYYNGQNLTRYNSKYGEQADYIEKGKFIDNSLSDIDKQYSQEIEQFRKDASFKDNSDLIDKAKKHKQFTDDEYNKYQELKTRRNELISKYDDVANQYNQKYGTNYTTEEFYKEYEKKYKDGKTGTRVTNEGFYRTNLRKEFSYLDYDTQEIAKDSNGNSVFATIEPEKADPNKINLDAMKDNSSINAEYNKLIDKDFGEYENLFDDKNNVVDSNIKKLADLKRKGIDIGAEGEEVLKYGAASINSKGIVDNDPSYTAINKNASTLANKYNISNENIQYLNTKSTNKNPISLTMDQDGNVSFSKSAWNKMTDDERKLYKDFDGTGDLSELSDNISNRGYMKDAISNNNFKGTDDEFLEDINKKWKYSKDTTSKYGMTKAQQFKEMGASDEMISKLEKVEKLTGQDLKGFKYQQFDESYIELGNMDEDVMNSMIDSYKKEGITSLNNLGTNNNKQVKAAAIYENIIKNKTGALNDISDDFQFNLDVSDEKAVRKFLENIQANRTTDDKIDVAKMMSEYVTKSKAKSAGKLNVGKIVEAYTQNGTTGVSDLIKDTNDQNSKDMFNKAFDKVIGVLEKSDNGDLKNLAGHFKKMARDDNFTKDVIEKTAFEETIEKAPEFKTLKDGKGIEIAKKTMGNKAVQIGAGIVAAVGAGSLAVNAMSKAAEERERKRQEMNMLIASQNASVRGGY